MDASNRARKQPAGRGAPRRPNCSRGSSRAQAAQSRLAAGTDTIAEPRQADGGLALTVTVVPLESPATNPLRAQQLAVIVELLQQAAAEATAQNGPTRDDPG
jgi:hypothetical protein